LRAGQGAHFSLAIREQVDLVAALAGGSVTTIATVARGGASLYELDLTGPIIWLVGNEGAGLTPELAAVAKVRATIPLANGTESLNVAAATAVCLFEAKRQRLKINSNALRVGDISHRGIPSAAKVWT
jgi:TrmH family RNA methyltransferase